MFELDVTNALPYLVSRGYTPQRIMELGGGVSNTVLLVEAAELRFILKQSLGRLRVEEEWLADRDRALRECRALRELAPFLPPGSLPGILFEDAENYLFAMESAPADAEPWKTVLLRGDISPETAATAGRMLAAMIRAGLADPSWAASFGGQSAFDQLRLDPYYRFTASRHPDLAPHFRSLIEETRARQVTLVHGDWSPKNLLVAGRRVMAIDFEVLHFGDPSFDAAFLLNHLLLKSFHRPQWSPLYRQAAAGFWAEVEGTLDWFASAAMRHLGCLLLARIDGKSPAEYIQSGDTKVCIRRYARELILHPPPTAAALWERWLC